MAFMEQPAYDKNRPDAPRNSDLMPIAVVGMGCRLPGGTMSPTLLWEMLSGGLSAWSHVPEQRFTVDSLPLKFVKVHDCSCYCPYIY
jgi:hypothetical protein